MFILVRILPQKGVTASKFSFRGSNSYLIISDLSYFSTPNL